MGVENRLSYRGAQACRACYGRGSNELADSLDFSAGRVLSDRFIEIQSDRRGHKPRAYRCGGLRLRNLSLEPPTSALELADFYVAFGTSLETLYGPCSGKAKFRRDQLEPQLRGILGEGMEAPLSLLLFVEFSPSIYIFHAVPQHVVHQTG